MQKALYLRVLGPPPLLDHTHVKKALSHSTISSNHKVSEFKTLTSSKHLILCSLLALASALLWGHTILHLRSILTWVLWFLLRSVWNSLLSPDPTLSQSALYGCPSTCDWVISGYKLAVGNTVSQDPLSPPDLHSFLVTVMKYPEKGDSKNQGLILVHLFGSRIWGVR